MTNHATFDTQIAIGASFSIMCSSLMEMMVLINQCQWTKGKMKIDWIKSRLLKEAKKNLQNTGQRLWTVNSSRCLPHCLQISAFVPEILKEARKGILLLQWLWNDGRLQRRIFNGVGKLYVSLQLYCWAILWGYLWRHISYHGNA